MKSFNQFYRKLTINPSKQMVVIVKGKKHPVKAMARLTAKNCLEGEYIKVYFQNDGYLLIIPQDKEIYYSEKLQHKIPSITDSMIGKNKIIRHNGKKYKLASQDDYQFVLELMVGSPLEIEGECRFSDYYPVKGPKEFLSLGWLSYNGQRADLNCQIIDVAEVSIVPSN